MTSLFFKGLLVILPVSFVMSLLLLAFFVSEMLFNLFVVAILIVCISVIVGFIIDYFEAKESDG